MATLKIIDAGPNKLHTVKVVKDYTGLGLKECKDIVDQEGTFKVNDADVNAVIRSFEEIEARVKVED